jgi:hypothetical protein
MLSVVLNVVMLSIAHAGYHILNVTCLGAQV